MPTPSDWEPRFQTMAAPPSATEREKCDNAERVLKAAVAADPALSTRNSRIVRQGSYRNNTNVRQESDVDLALVCSDTFYYDLPPGTTSAQFGITPSTYKYPDFKNEVHHALQVKFTNGQLSRGNKAFDITANSYRVDADIAPFFDYRLYRLDGTWTPGIALMSDHSGQIINWPEQHYANGVLKNDATGRRFKQAVRILKSLRYDLVDLNVPSATKVIGFAIECAIWNVPNEYFGHATLYDDVRAIINVCHAHALDPTVAAAQKEVNGIKSLYGPHQKWTREGMAEFLASVWSHVGF